MAVEAFAEFAQRAYVDLRVPDFSGINDAIERRPYASLVERFGEFCTVEDGEHKSWHDDVALCVMMSDQGWTATVWLSCVAPYAAMVAGPVSSRAGWLRDEDFVYSGSAAESWLARIRLDCRLRLDA